MQSSTVITTRRSSQSALISLPRRGPLTVLSKRWKIRDRIDLSWRFSGIRSLAGKTISFLNACSGRL